VDAYEIDCKSKRINNTSTVVYDVKGLAHQDQLLIAQGQLKNDERNFSAYLNNWRPIEELDLMNP
jgi:hypothetical protein